MPVAKIFCPLCEREISKSNYAKHELRHKNNPDSFNIPRYRLNHDGLDCQFCGRAFSTRNGLCNHERQCKKNPDMQVIDRSSIPGFNEKGRAAWNKGLTKDTDERVRKIGEILHSKYASGELVGSFTGRSHTAETKQKLSQIAIANGYGGHPHRRYIEYKGVLLDSGLELLLAQKLDSLDIEWQRCSRFPYTDLCGKKHHYTPDFYLPEYDVYLDPKNDFLINNVNPALGYKDLDKIRWVMEQNNIKVIILSEEQVNNFDISKLCLGGPMDKTKDS